MLNYSIKIIQRIILFAFILLLTFNIAGCKRNTITIQYMLEVPNLQFVETRYYFATMSSDELKKAIKEILLR